MLETYKLKNIKTNEEALIQVDILDEAKDSVTTEMLRRMILSRAKLDGFEFEDSNDVTLTKTELP